MLHIPEKAVGTSGLRPDTSPVKLYERGKRLGIEMQLLIFSEAFLDSKRQKNYCRAKYNNLCLI